MTKKNRLPENRESKRTSHISRPKGHIGFNVSLSDRDNFIHVLSQQKWTGDEITVFHKGELSELQSLKQICLPLLKEASNVHFKQSFEKDNFPQPSVFLHFKGGEKKQFLWARERKILIICEETLSTDDCFKTLATDMSPFTSFSYLVDKFLKGD